MPCFAAIIQQNMQQKTRDYKTVFYLSIFTIVYNIAEGLVATYFGMQEESLALFGFGVDSFVEVVSGAGIAHMMYRIWKHKGKHESSFEKTALQITGYSFYLLVIYLIAQAAWNIYQHHTPENTSWDIIIACVSMAIMWLLIRWKTLLGNRLQSKAILADAACAKVCLYMSLVLLASGILYQYTGFIYADSIGALGIAYFSYKEGRECFDHASGHPHEHCDC